MKPKLNRFALATTVGVDVPAQTYTAIMSGENSEYFVFPNNANPRSTVTSIQSPFFYPNSYVGSLDTQVYPAGNSSLTPPWWFYYSGIDPNTGLYIEVDQTGNHPTRSPSYGQTSSQKSAVIGIRAKANFSGAVSGSSGAMYEVIYFSERADWAGQREFGFSRDMQPGASLDKIYFYWSTNSNCSINYNMNYPFCRTSQATTGSKENPTLAPLAAEYFLPTEITLGRPHGVMYYFIGYLFWASWDSTYKFRVEVWDSTLSTQITAFNVDTSSGGVNYGATTSGMNGYVTLGTLRSDPNNALSQSAIRLFVNSIEIAQ